VWHPHAWNEKQNQERICGGVEEKRKQKMNDACWALYITALVAGVLELETNILHMLDPMVRCICTAIMVAIPLSKNIIFWQEHDTPDMTKSASVKALVLLRVTHIETRTFYLAI
jgi:hypothetical protein